MQLRHDFKMLKKKLKKTQLTDQCQMNLNNSTFLLHLDIRGAKKVTSIFRGSELYVFLVKIIVP